MKKVVLILWGGLLINGLIHSQTIDYGINYVWNINFVHLKSDYEIYNDKCIKPRFGRQLGVIGKLKMNEKFSVFNSIDYYYLRNADKSEINWTDENGEIIFISKKRILNNHYLQYSCIPSYRINNISIGTGININYLFLSRTVYNDYPDAIFEASLKSGRFTNHYYKKINYSIPIKLAYYYKGVDIFYQFNKGITNKLKGNDAFTKEYDNTFSFGCDIYLNKVFKND